MVWRQHWRGSGTTATRTPWKQTFARSSPNAYIVPSTAHSGSCRDRTPTPCTVTILVTLPTLNPLGESEFAGDVHTLGGFNYVFVFLKGVHGHAWIAPGTSVYVELCCPAVGCVVRCPWDTQSRGKR